MITYGTSFPNCSERCQTHATVCGRVMMLVESSASLQMKSCQEMECTIAVKPTNQHFCHSIVTGMLQHSLYVNLTFLSLAAVSPCQSQLGFFFMNQLCDNVFMRLTSDQHVCLWYFANLWGVLPAFYWVHCTHLQPPGYRLASNVFSLSQDRNSCSTVSNIFWIHLFFPRGFYDKVFPVSEWRHSLTGYDLWPLVCGDFRNTVEPRLPSNKMWFYVKICKNAIVFLNPFGRVDHFCDHCITLHLQYCV